METLPTSDINLIAGIEASQLKAILSRGETLVCDIRPSDEYQKDHIDGAFSLALPAIIFKRFAKLHLENERALEAVAMAEGIKKIVEAVDRLSPQGLLVVYDAKTSHLEDQPQSSPLYVFCEYFAKIGKATCYIQGGLGAVRRDAPELIVAGSGGAGHFFQGQPLAPASLERAAQISRANARQSFMTAEESALLGIAHKLEKLNFMHGFLAVGSEAHGQNLDFLLSEGFTHVVNVTQTPFDERVSRRLKTLQIPVNDTLTENLLPYFFQALCFIDSARRNGGKVLVHCYAGISRSVSICVAYIIWAHGLPVSDALAFVKSHRPQASPNLNFHGQLIMFERTLRELPGIGISKEKLRQMCPILHAQ